MYSLVLALSMLFLQTSVNVVLPSPVSFLDEFEHLPDRGGFFGQRLLQNPPNITRGQSWHILLMTHPLVEHTQDSQHT